MRRPTLKKILVCILISITWYSLCIYVTRTYSIRTTTSTTNLLSTGNSRAQWPENVNEALSLSFRKPPIQNFICKIPDLNCAALFEAEKHGREYRVKHWRTTVPEGFYIDLKRFIQLSESENYCERWITEQRFITEPLSEDEAEFPIAYSIMVHKDAAQFVRLLRAIYRPQNLYCIHVDASSDKIFQTAMIAFVECFANVKTPPRQIDVVYRTFSSLEADLACMRELLKYPGWKYFINLTGQELPLQTSLAMVAILKAFNGANNIEMTVRHRNEYRYAGAPPPPPGFNVTKGAVHIIASRAFVDYAVYNATALRFLDWVKQTSDPDETYFSTLNNSPHLGVPGAPYLVGGVGAADSPESPFLARYKNWANGRGHPCSGRYVRGVCVFGVGDLSTLARRRELFANKFDVVFEPATSACVEELVCNRTRDELKGTRVFDAAYYTELAFTRNHV